jgi:selenide,water dikinase
LAQVLRPLNGLFPIEDYPDLLVGLAQPDDSAVYRLNPEQAVISTVDFFPPVVDAPYSFGAIAAANALSDVYAMGGEPIFAINLAAYPDGFGLDILTEILRGGAEKVREAGAVIVGGHTVTDKEPKYGLAVTGLVHPEHVYRKGGAQPGDALVLTKALGTGVVTTALKQERASDSDVEAAVASMMKLNRDASRAARRYRVHAMTDITGYSLLGHAHEMAHLSENSLVINYRSLNWLPGAQSYGEQDIFPGGMARNRDFYKKWVRFGANLREHEQKLLFDPETSGGLLIALHADDARDYCSHVDGASIIGSVEEGDTGKIVVKE